MKPKVWKRADCKNWWNVTYFDGNKIRTVFADSWRDALALVKHGYKMGYIK